MPMSARSKIGASGSGLIASTVPAARTPTMWLNLPLAPMLTNRRGAIDRPVMPIWRARRSQPLSVTLRVAPSSAPSSARSGSSAVVLVGRDPRADADHGVRLGEHVEVVVAGAGEDAHPAARASIAIVPTGRRRVARGASVGQHAGADRRHLDRRRAVDRGDELTAERGLPRDEPVVVDARARPRRR